uniref:Survival motor neuron Tudor domain-containing protein n=1 Tax=Picocystis salinarum TaxID=88271 RepID=A0A7S3UCR7_9CHLO
MLAYLLVDYSMCSAPLRTRFFLLATTFGLFTSTFLWLGSPPTCWCNSSSPSSKPTATRRGGAPSMSKRNQTEDWDDRVLRNAYQRALDKYARAGEATRRTAEESWEEEEQDRGRRGDGAEKRGEDARHASQRKSEGHHDRYSTGDPHGASGDAANYYPSPTPRTSDGVSSPHATYGYYTPPFPPHYPPPPPQYMYPYAMPPAFGHSAPTYASPHSVPSPWQWPPAPQEYPPSYQSLPTPPAPPSHLPVPEGPLESLQDEEISALLMSWYYAGFYTGRASAATERKEPAETAGEFADLKL